MAMAAPRRLPRWTLGSGDEFAEDAQKFIAVIPTIPDLEGAGAVLLPLIWPALLPKLRQAPLGPHHRLVVLVEVGVGVGALPSRVHVTERFQGEAKPGGAARPCTQGAVRGPIQQRTGGLKLEAPELGIREAAVLIRVEVGKNCADLVAIEVAGVRSVTEDRSIGSGVKPFLLCLVLHQLGALLSAIRLGPKVPDSNALMNVAEQSGEP